uniref:Uncharacterized protein n=1 Tax=Utricularia reniformis TaxID=192314 RepID=A0A1Y0AZR4_9LAMI|nr:hypothetical protein AEK19_MT0349 [Utricularia reniformis]YP_009382736.1 hypothetical protein AEK19_MT2303 [Utricularia reniformis]ART30621.1 hypothetical protein AEK19_MT0349 [Utricularia reniformis]ART32446.1 hypothetical protein AEK19_MT2303 [Utricularia reniformis]
MFCLIARLVARYGLLPYILGSHSVQVVSYNKTVFLFQSHRSNHCSSMFVRRRDITSFLVWSYRPRRPCKSSF